MSAVASDLPRFIRDLLASPPKRGEGLNLWLYRVARLSHAYRDRQEIIELLQAATAGEAIKRGEIEPAVERSAATAWKHDDGASLREALKTCGSIVQSPDAPAGFTVHQSEKHNATQVTSRANGAKGGRPKNHGLTQAKPTG